ncbi:unnamed protein product [Vitrella brassicaformis CCMP3155]|uniref:Ion transport domain-containing protein n=3 Tax=Vitrella brassicaformis TaxID=1169539 RepID=A0A0G4F4U2_VITBC|nr:unnamed protein product [Vitrella brassicaformis CCMP3155]|eukprot:CEM06954.1 unnamed protein product [Vitrella brassicaformis CCMP3155]
MLGVWTQGSGSPRVQGREGSISSDAKSRPSADDPGYVQLPRVEDGEKEAIAHGQTMAVMSRQAASASSDNVPLLLGNEEGHVELQLADVEHDVPFAPRLLEEVPLVGAPAIDEATKPLRDRIESAVYGRADTAALEQLREDLASLPHDRAERMLTTGDWIFGSAIHDAADESGNKYSPPTVEVFEVLLHNRRHLLKLKNRFGYTPLHYVAMKGGGDDLVEKFIEWGGKDLLKAQNKYGSTPLHYLAEKGGRDHLVKKLIEWGGKDLLTAQNRDRKTPLHYVAERGGGNDLVKKFVELGGKDLLKARDKGGRTPLHSAAASGHASMLETMLEMAPDLLEDDDWDGHNLLDVAAEANSAGVLQALVAKNPDLLTKGPYKSRGIKQETPFHVAIRLKCGKAAGAMLAASEAKGVVIWWLGFNKKLLDSVLQPDVLPGVIPFMKQGFAQYLRHQSWSVGFDSVRWCSFFRKFMQSRQKDSLTDDIAGSASWLEAFAAEFCTNTREEDFRRSVEGREERFFEHLESAEPLTVVTQANCINLITHHWRHIYDAGAPLAIIDKRDTTDASWTKEVMKSHGTEFSPRSAFFSRVLSMLLMVFSVLLHTRSIKGDGVAAAGQSVWLWSALATGVGFIVVEWFQLFRLKAHYWKDSWNYLDCVSGVSIAAFIAIHFIGWSTEAEVGSGIVVALLFALRLLQAASLLPNVGPLILAVVRMLADIRKFLLLYLYILLVFAGVFTILSSDEDHDYFGSYGQAMLALFYAGLGDFNDALNDAIESHDTLGAVLLFTYIILSSIILLNLLIAIMASTYSAIEDTQDAQYQLLRIRVLNEYLTMPPHERLPPPFNLIAFLLSAPLPYLASLISADRRQQSTMCRIAFWCMVALYATIDGLLFTVAFTPTFILSALERLPHVLQEKAYGSDAPWACLFQRAEWLWQRLWNAIVLTLLTPLSILRFFMLFVEMERLSAANSSSFRLPEVHIATESIDEWIRAADSHNATSPDIMAVLQVMDKRQMEMDDRLKEIGERQMRMDDRLTEMETQIKRKIQ